MKRLHGSWPSSFTSVSFLATFCFITLCFGGSTNDLGSGSWRSRGRGRITGPAPTCAERHRGTPTAASAHRSTPPSPPPTSSPGRRRDAPAMPSSYLTSPSSSASSHLSYLIPANARAPLPAPPLAMGQGYGATSGIGVPTTSGVVANAMNAAAAAPPPTRQGDRSANAGHPPLPRPPPRQCPRCQSANTKFCYYNNYSREQPRYLCKACRRHWTEGGTLRDVPVGGGRKNRRGVKGSSGSGGAAKASASAVAATQGGNALGLGADTFPEDFLRQLVQFQPAAAVGGGGYAIDLSAWQQMTAATAPPPQGTGDVSTLGAAGAAAEAAANCVTLQYWSEWQQDGMPGLDGAC